MLLRLRLLPQGLRMFLLAFVFTASIHGQSVHSHFTEIPSSPIADRTKSPDLWPSGPTALPAEISSFEKIEQPVFPLLSGKKENDFPIVRPKRPLNVANFEKIVLPISEIDVGVLDIQGRFGTGFCLDPKCRFVGTNYHVAVIAHSTKIKGSRVIRRYLATGPDDDDATLNNGTALPHPMKYAIGRDLAIFELQRPPSGYHGIDFSTEDLRPGQEVDIYCYPKESADPFRSLRVFQGSFRGQTTAGLLAFDYEAVAGQPIRPGASGGIVVDRPTQRIVGILSATAITDELTALAVPVEALARFVAKVEPSLATKMFPATIGSPPTLQDIYQPLVRTHTGGLEHRPQETADITILREKAQFLADSIHNFIAVQTFSWGSGFNPPAANSAYEIRMIDGFQRFRKFPNGKEEFQDVPLPPLGTVLGTAAEWSLLPEMIGTALHLKIVRREDTVINGHQLKVFQYYADAEDNLCKFKSVLDLGVFAWNRVATVNCYGEVWTDANTNIVRISSHYELSGSWKGLEVAVIYGWLNRQNELPKLVPVTFSTQAIYKKKLYWCRGRFENYQVFDSRVRMVSVH